MNIEYAAFLISIIWGICTLGMIYFGYWLTLVHKKETNIRQKKGI